MSRVRSIAAVGIIAAALAGCASSAPATQTSATGTTAAATRPSSAPGAVGTTLATSPARARSVAIGDVDGDGHPDRAQLVYLGGYGPDNWELVVNMTTLGQRSVRFTGGPVLRGNIDAPTIAGSADADRDGHAEIFVKVDAGASTQAPGQDTTWTYQRDTYAWSGARLVLVSERTGKVASAHPPAADTGVSCGNLPQYAPAYPASS